MVDDVLIWWGGGCAYMVDDVLMWWGGCAYVVGAVLIWWMMCLCGGGLCLCGGGLCLCGGGCAYVMDDVLNLIFIGYASPKLSISLQLNGENSSHFVLEHIPDIPLDRHALDEVHSSIHTLLNKCIRANTRHQIEVLWRIL